LRTDSKILFVNALSVLQKTALTCLVVLYRLCVVRTMVWNELPGTDFWTKRASTCASAAVARVFVAPLLAYWFWMDHIRYPNWFGRIGRGKPISYYFFTIHIIAQRSKVKFITPCKARDVLNVRRSLCFERNKIK